MAGGAAASRTAPPRGEAPTLERALATAVLRVADGLAGLGLSTGGRQARRLDRSGAFEGFDERALCLPVDPADHDPLLPARSNSEGLAARMGLVVLHPGLTDALVEVQTIGRVTGPARPPRRPTRIDAALAQPFARAVLEQLLRQLPAGGDEPRPGTLRVGSFIAGPASLGLILTAPEYLRLDLELRLGDGARVGGLSLLLPAGAAARAEPDAAPADPEGAWAEAMRAAALAAPVRLQAVLPPIRLPLARLVSLRVGDLIPLDPSALADVTLHGGASGVTIPGRKRLPGGASLRARLGQLNGQRAVKVAALPHERRDGPPAPGGDGDFSVRPALTEAADETDATPPLPAPQPETRATGGRAVH